MGVAKTLKIMYQTIAMNEQAYFIKRLDGELRERQKRNSSYSLRAFARFLEINPSVLSAVLTGKRSIPKTRVQSIVKKLELSPTEEKRFLQSLQRRKTLEQLRSSKEEIGHLNLVAQLLEEKNHFKIISEWEHYAVFELIETDGFRSDNEWIAKHLGITTDRVESVLQCLIDCKIVQKDANGEYVKRPARLKTTSDISSSALRKAHKEALKIAAKKLESVPVNRRYFGSSTMAIDPNRLPEAKALIEDFQKKIGYLLEEGNRTDVYHLGVQLFPFTVEG